MDGTISDIGASRLFRHPLKYGSLKTNKVANRVRKDSF